MITADQLKQILVHSKLSNIELYLPFLNEFMPKYGIVSLKQKSAFLAQIGHESGHLSAVKENLNYSAANLKSIFKKYFPTDNLAAEYARNPERIANRVYANRMGNGNENSGDGWKYIGRGLIQITGKNNYTEVSKGLNVNLVEQPDLLCTPKYAVESACWWWQKAGLNQVAEA